MLAGLLAWLLATAAPAQTSSEPDRPRTLFGQALIVPQGLQSEAAMLATAKALLARAPAAAERLTPDRHHPADQLLWLRFELHGQGEPREWFLRLPGSRLQRAVLYTVGPSGTLQVQQAGEAVAGSQWALSTRDITFRLGTLGDTPQRYVLRLENHLPYHLVAADVVDAAQLAHAEALDGLLHGGYLGVLLFALAFSVVNFVGRGDRLFGWYALFLAVMVLHHDFLTGLSRSLWLPDAPELWQTMRLLTLLLPFPTGLAVIRALMPPQLIGRRVHAACTAGIVLGLLLALAVPALPPDWAWMAINGFGVAVLALVGVVLQRSWQPRHWLLYALAISSTAALVPMLVNLGLLPPSPWSAHAIIVGGILEALILCVALSIGIGDDVLQQLVRRDRRPRDPVTGLPGPELLPQMVQTLMMRHRRTGQGSAVILLEIGNAQDLVLHHGNEILEPMLKAACRVIRAQLRGPDVTLRLGRARFAVVVARAGNHPEALAVAQRIIDQGLRHPRELPPPEHLRFHAAVAFLPDDASGRASLLVQALGQQLDQIRPGSGLVLRELRGAAR